MNIIEDTRLMIPVNEDSDWAVQCPSCGSVIQFKDNECVRDKVPNTDIPCLTLTCLICNKPMMFNEGRRRLVLQRKNLTEENLSRAMRNPGIIIV